MNELITPLVSFVAAVIGGFIMGYAAKKLIKIALVVVGVILFIIVIAQGYGYVILDYDKITADATTLVNNANLYPQLTNFTNQFSIFVLAGLTIGGVLGFVKGG